MQFDLSSYKGDHQQKQFYSASMYQNYVACFPDQNSYPNLSSVYSSQAGATGCYSGTSQPPNLQKYNSNEFNFEAPMKQTNLYTMNEAAFSSGFNAGKNFFMGEKIDRIRSNSSSKEVNWKSLGSVPPHASSINMLTMQQNAYNQRQSSCQKFDLTNCIEKPENLSFKSFQNVPSNQKMSFTEAFNLPSLLTNISNLNNHHITKHFLDKNCASISEHNQNPLLPSNCDPISSNHSSNNSSSNNTIFDSLLKMRKKSPNDRKSPKFVPDEDKNEVYRDKRKKNNESAKRSRKTRKEKEKTMTALVVQLETENGQLKAAINSTLAEAQQLRYELSYCPSALTTRAQVEAS